MNMSEMLNTGKSIKLSLKKSRTYPKIILSYILQPMPATSIAAQKPAKVENFSAFFIEYKRIIKIAIIEKMIKNNCEFSSMLKAAPVFCTKIKSKTGLSMFLNLILSRINSEKYKSKTIKNITEIMK